MAFSGQTPATIAASLCLKPRDMDGEDQVRDPPLLRALVCEPLKRADQGPPANRGRQKILWSRLERREIPPEGYELRTQCPLPASGRVLRCGQFSSLGELGHVVLQRLQAFPSPCFEHGLLLGGVCVWGGGGRAWRIQRLEMSTSMASARSPLRRIVKTTASPLKQASE